MTYSSKALGRILEAYLKLSSASSKVEIDEISDHALIPREEVEEILKSLRLYDEKTMQVDGEMRVSAALKALEIGVEGERISRYLTWREFEALAERAFRKAGYQTIYDLRLSYLGRRCQIDLLAWREGIILVIDCKHWAKPPSPSEEREIISAQERRLIILRDSLRALFEGKGDFIKTFLIPVSLTLYQPSKKILQGHLFASIGRLRGLLEYLESAYYELRHERIEVPRELSLKEIISRLASRPV